MRHFYLITLLLFIPPDCETRQVELADDEQPRLVFSSTFEARGLRQLYLFDGAQPETLVKVNSPLSHGCTGQPWYKRFIGALVSSARANSGDVLEGCFRGVRDFWVSPNGRHVLYTVATDELDFYDLHLVDLNSPGNSIVVNEPQQEHHVPHVAAISPDGQNFVYFDKSVGESVKSLYFVETNNPAIQQQFAESLITGEEIFSARYSPTGANVAYLLQSGNSATGVLHLADTAQLNRPPVMIADDFDFSSGRYDFSAHGSHIIYIRMGAAPGESSIVMVDTTFAHDEKIIGYIPNTIIPGLHLSPNRRFLVYGSFDVTTQHTDMHIVDLSTLGVRYYSESELVGSFSAWQPYTVPISPDSATMVTQSEAPFRSKQLLKFSVDDPTNRIAVSPINPLFDFGYTQVFTPDSQNIIYRASFEGQDAYGGLYITNLNGQINAERLSVTAGHSVHSFSLSLNGRFIAYVAKENGPGSAHGRSLYLIDRANGNGVITTPGSASSALAHKVIPHNVEFLPPGPAYRE